MKRLFYIVASLLLVACMSFAGVALADNASTRGLTVTPVDGTATIWTDKSEYRVGDPVKIFFKASVDGFAAIYDYDNSGSSKMIWPRNGQAAFVNAGRTYSIPDGNWNINASEPIGNDTLVLVVSQAKSNLTLNLNLSFLFGGNNKRGLTTSDGNASVVSSVNDEITAQTTFKVFPRYVNPVLRITGSNGARIFVDGNDFGTTTNLTLDPGYHQVVALQPGMKVEFKDFNMKANGSYDFWVRFKSVK